VTKTQSNNKRDRGADLPGLPAGRQAAGRGTEKKNQFKKFPFFNFVPLALCYFEPLLTKGKVTKLQ
jgi:hypothetical protein